MPDDIVRAARGHLDKDERFAVDLIEQLTDVLEKKRIEEERLRVQRQQLERAQAELAKEHKNLIQSREGILAELKERGEVLVAEAESELRSTIVRLQQGGMRTATGTRKRIEEIREKLNAATASKAKHADRGMRPSEEGQWVRLRGTRASGILLRIKDQGRRGELQMGPKRVEVDMDSLEVVPGKDTPDVRDYGIKVVREDAGTSQHRLHLIGLRVDEAIPLLDKAIDRAMVDGYTHIHVIHGHGTGKLRQAIQDFLRQHSVVKGFHAENQAAGGTGVTVVELKD
jgi:DNA mismatch repair protein MutS2